MKHIKSLKDLCILSLFSRVQLFVTLWTIAHQALLSLGFSRQEYWRELPVPPPGDLPDQGLKPGILHCRQILYQLSHREAQTIEQSLKKKKQTRSIANMPIVAIK